MRPSALRSFPVLAAFVALSTALAGCPEKGGPADKTTAEPEPAEPDDQGKLDDKAKKPAAPPAAAAPAEEKKADDGKEEGGW